MGTAVNRITFEIRLSVNPPDYDLAEWVIDPVIPEEPTRYWVSPIVGDTIELEDAAGQAAADVAYIAELKKEKKAELEDIVGTLVEQQYSGHRRELIQLEFHEARALGLTNKLAYISQMTNWVRIGAANLFVVQDTVDAASTEEEINAITIDLSSWIAADPLVSIRTAGGIID
jgi:hypothetical protein